MSEDVGYTYMARSSFGAKKLKLGNAVIEIQANSELLSSFSSEQQETGTRQCDRERKSLAAISLISSLPDANLKHPNTTC